MTDMDEVSEVLEHDPALTAKILRISNSPYYGMKQYVGTLKLALVVLGVREVRNIVLGVSVYDAFSADNPETAFAKDFWAHAFLTGGLSKQLATRLRLAVQGEAFISGLLHDMGQLVLVKQIGDEYLAILDEAGKDYNKLIAAEMETYGFTHAHAGAALARRWNYPEALTDTVLRHHPLDDVPISTAKDPVLAAVVRVGDLCAHDSLMMDEEESTFKSAVDDEAWVVLDSAPEPIAKADRVAVLTEIVNELKDSPPPQF
jgi:HD-like signal output (HDOD) protein